MNDTTVIVVSYNTRDLTLQAVTAARRASADLSAQVVVVDNGSRDGTCEAVRAAHAEVPVLSYPDNPGYGAALNRACLAFPASFLCALNGDVLLDPDSLITLRRFLDDHPQCGAVGPRLTGRDGKPQPSCKRFPTLGLALGEVFAFHALFPENRWVRRFYCSDMDLTRPATVQTVSGAVMLIREDAFRRIGGFDHGFRMYFEETDLCRRLHDAGYGVAFCPTATAVHWHGASTLRTSVREVEYYLSYIRYFRKHHGRVAAGTLATAVGLLTLARVPALALKYLPVSRMRAHLLGTKLAACGRLLWQLPHAAGDPGSREGRP
jgi:GT2 family glycosyltransferase